MNIKSCPCCDNTVLDVIWDMCDNVYRVRCKTCFLYGPSGESGKAAIDMWNFMYRRPKLNNPKPTTEGYYWTKVTEDSEPTIVHIFRYNSDLLVTFPGDDEEYFLSDMDNYAWSERICNSEEGDL